MAPTGGIGTHVSPHPGVLAVESLLVLVLLQPLSSTEEIDFAADCGLPIGLKVHKPGFELGICDNIQVSCT